jgi:hypothetical protein
VGISKWEPVEPIGDEIVVRLYAKVNGVPVTLGAGRLTREVGRVEHDLEFDLSADGAAVLEQVGEKNLGLAFEESYYGRYVRSDLTATLSCTTETQAAFRNVLSKGSGGKENAVLVAFGGTVSQELALRQFLRQAVSIKVQTRLGAKVDPALLDRVVGKLFDAQAKEAEARTLQDRDYVTFLFSNGVRVSGVVGEFKKLGTEGRKEMKRRIENESTWDVIRDEERELKLKGEGSFLGISAGAEGHVRKKDYERFGGSNKTVSVAEDMECLSKALEGTLPVVALNADQIQSLASVSEKDIRVAIETFTDGEKTLTHRVSLQPPGELTVTDVKSGAVGSAPAAPPTAPEPSEPKGGRGKGPHPDGDIQRILNAPPVAGTSKTGPDPKGGPHRIVFRGWKDVAVGEYVLDPRAGTLTGVTDDGKVAWRASPKRLAQMRWEGLTMSLCEESGRWVRVTDGRSFVILDAETGKACAEGEAK